MRLVNKIGTTMMMCVLGAGSVVPANSETYLSIRNEGIVRNGAMVDTAKCDPGVYRIVFSERDYEVICISMPSYQEHQKLKSDVSALKVDMEKLVETNAGWQKSTKSEVNAKIVEQIGQVLTPEMRKQIVDDATRQAVSDVLSELRRKGVIP